MRTNVDDLRVDGYVRFESVVPVDLCIHCVDEINQNADEYFYWNSPLADEFRLWFRAFLGDTLPSVFGESTFSIANRNVGNSLAWHEDSSGGNPDYGRRVFCNAYLTPTTKDRGPLVVNPKSHLGPRVLEFVESPKTIALPAGSVVVGDERLWHMAAENKGPNRRTMVIWWRWIPISGEA